MRKSVEIKKAIKNKNAEIKKFTNEGDFEAAAALADDLNKMLDELKATEAVEKSEEPELEPENDAEDDEIEEEDEDSDTTNRAAFVPINRMSRSKKAKLRNRAFNKLLFGEKKFGKLTNEERRAYYDDGTYTTTSPTPSTTPTGLIGGDDEKGGYTVPTEQMAILREYRKAYTPLREYCHVVTAQSRSGNFPTLGDETGVLVNFSEMTQINESDFDFGQTQYSISDYGDIIPVSNTLIQDANVNILEIVGKRLMRKTVNTENAAILNLLSGLTATTITDYKGLTKALNVSLDPVYYADAKIFTNQDGFQWLSELEDDNKRPLMIPDMTDADTYRFRGKEIVVLPNSQLVTSSNKAPLYVGNLADYCIFFARQEIEIATSTEYKFGLNATSLRCITRFGVAADDTDAMIKLQVSIS